MLMIADALRKLDFSKLMEVYAESNGENGAEFYPHLPAGQQLLQAEQDFYQYLRTGFFDRAGDRYCIWEENGKYICALRLQCYQDGLLLEALETHPDHRKKGYAKKLICTALDTVETDKIYVHISHRNAASIAVHTACGFQKILDYSVYADGSVNRHCQTYLYEKTTL